MSSNQPKLKVLTVVGTRPELIRLSAVIKKLTKLCDHTLVHTGQNYDYELNEVFFNDLGLPKPNFYLNSSGLTPSETIANVIRETEKVINFVNPDAFLILGDTNSCLSAISAKRHKVPIFHMEAGNRCFDFRVPEEINRKIVDHISDVNLPYTNIAREYLIAEGLRRDLIVKTGSPMLEVLNSSKEGIDSSVILETLNLKSHNYFLVSVHREENVSTELSIKSFVEMLNNLASVYDLPIIVSTHPRTRIQIDKYNLKIDGRVVLSKPFGFFDYIKLQINSKVVLSDSGTITEESSILGFNALNIREAHERPEGFEEGAVMMVGFNMKSIFNALDILDDRSRNGYIGKTVADYNVSNVSDIVINAIISYTDYVNRTVWRKNV